MEIKIEHLRKEHIDGVWELNYKAWYEDEDIDDLESKKAQANIDLRDMLAQGTYAMVATDDEKVVGIAIAQSNYSDNTLPILKTRANDDAYKIAKGSGKSRNDYTWYYELETAAYEKLLAGREEEFDGELVLLITSDAYRGQGIGKKLLEEMELYFKTEGVKKYFLKTDDSCNYNFYDRYGLEKLGEISAREANNSDTDYNLYLYGNTLEEL